MKFNFPAFFPILSFPAIPFLKKISEENVFTRNSLPDYVTRFEVSYGSFACLISRSVRFNTPRELFIALRATGGHGYQEGSSPSTISSVLHII